ncbi:hypothetical protein C6569_04970 [Phreatobacter cathodiphilus]|uniref:DUF3309 domain-containing protein n=2 Tax=Phreatobacter cathodiphilus TaxID=1868589 RepID=A0A2S0N8H6_9HYPH|nr:hypothetical protein C6569_04970 [Phreatobacter cathodiphilus]
MAPAHEEGPMWTGFLVVLLILVLVFGGYLGGTRGAGGSLVLLMIILTGLYLVGWLPDPWW